MTTINNSPSVPLCVSVASGETFSLEFDAISVIGLHFNRKHRHTEESSVRFGAQILNTD